MIDRLKQLLEHYKLTASNFAEVIDVPRSSISHLLSGRNKPSLDFVMKIDKAFNDVTLDWLLYGKGNFPKEEINESIIPEKEPTPAPSLFSTFTNNDISEKKEPKVINEEQILLKKKIKKIVILYTDGTFEDYNR